ncbi:YifB family Mg chelatase-like AAA ATPase [bacterium]|jgi:magnesium chelatase family protein|nr:YifB family Mg chelatase-like AAA ATPase [bacterium]
MHTKIYSATTIGVNAYKVRVEVDLSVGIMEFFIVGLADTAIKESRQRIRTALKNSGIPLPPKKITVNLAPANLKKEGTTFDLPIAIGILQAAGVINISKEFLKETLFLGELSLSGSIKPVKGVLPIAFDATKLKKCRMIVPHKNQHEAALIEDIEVIGVKNLVELIGYLQGEKQIQPTHCLLQQLIEKESEKLLNFSQVKGQSQAKRALEISAAGRHNILFIGAPGAGKTMLAKRLPTIMPQMSFEEILETSKVYSVSGKLGTKPLMTKRPFRCPHHTISQAGLAGGGTYPQPGEISLAQNGILFLDELTEFKRDTLEVLRQPLENKVVNISRVNQSVTFPASFVLVAALNPCPCGYWGDKRKDCTCSPQRVNKYLDKLSGPLLDRIDLQINIQSVKYETIEDKTTKVKSSQDILENVCKAAKKQKERGNGKTTWNANLSTDQIEQFCTLTPQAKEIIKKVFEKLSLSMRGYHKLLKVARTIADLDETQNIDTKHVQEALMYRSLDHMFEKKGY